MKSSVSVHKIIWPNIPEDISSLQMATFVRYHEIVIFFVCFKMKMQNCEGIAQAYKVTESTTSHVFQHKG